MRLVPLSLTIPMDYHPSCYPICFPLSNLAILVQYFRLCHYVSLLALSCYQVLELLLSAGAYTDVRDYRGFTPLIWSCVRKQPKAASLLLQAGADVHARDE
jgi:hypothetical protein